MRSRLLACTVLGACAFGAIFACSDFDSSPAIEGLDGGDDASAADGDPQAPPPDAGTLDATGESAYRAAVIADGPLVYWRMGAPGAANEIADEMQTGNALYLQGGGHEQVPGAIGRDGADNRAIRFDGKASFARAGDPGPLSFIDGAPFTLECWARREAVDGGEYFQHLIAKIDGFNDDTRGYSLYVAPYPTAEESGGSMGDGNDNKQAGVFGRVVAPDVWAHYALVFDGSTLRLYIDGTQEDVEPSSVKIPAHPGDFVIGRDPRNGSYHWPGAIDEIAIYGKALTIDTIARHASLGKL